VHKISVIEQALALHPERGPMDVLCNLGGYEMASILGGMLQANVHNLSPTLPKS